MPSVKLRGVSGNKLQRDNGTAGDDNEKIILVNKKNSKGNAGYT